MRTLELKSFGELIGDCMSHLHLEMRDAYAPSDPVLPCVHQ